MKILLTGASGLLGTAIQGEVQSRGMTCRTASRDQIWQCTASQRAAIIDGHDLLIHAAANTNVEQCELNPDECYRDNLLLTELLACAAASANVRLAFLSSAGVYGSAKQEPYREYDPACPTTHYHASKYMAERVVLQFSPHNLVIRTGWLFGGVSDNPKNFVARRLEDARSAFAGSGIIESNAEQWGVPCYARDVAVRILLLAELGHAGVFNCVNTGRASRFDYVRAIVDEAGISVSVHPTSAARFQRVAPVSNNEMAENWKMTCLGLPAMPNWRASLRSYLQEHLLAGTGM